MSCDRELEQKEMTSEMQEALNEMMKRVLAEQEELKKGAPGPDETKAPPIFSEEGAPKFDATTGLGKIRGEALRETMAKLSEIAKTDSGAKGQTLADALDQMQTPEDGMQAAMMNRAQRREAERKERRRRRFKR